MKAAKTIERKVYNVADLIEMGLGSRPSIYRWMDMGLFPRPIKIGPRRVGWPAEVIDQWIADRKDEEISQ